MAGLQGTNFISLHPYPYSPLTSVWRCGRGSDLDPVPGTSRGRENVPAVAATATWTYDDVIVSATALVDTT